MTLADTVELLKSVRKQTLVSVVSLTVPSLRAKADGVPNPFMLGNRLADGFNLVKINKVNGTINGDYEQQVTNRVRAEIIQERIEALKAPLDTEALKCEALQRIRFGESWHCPLIVENEVTCLSHHAKDAERLYLRFVYRSRGKAEYVSLDANTVDSELVAPFLPPVSKRDNQGLTEGNEVQFVVYAVESLAEIAVNGERIRIADAFEHLPDAVRAKVWHVADEYLAGERRMSVV